MPRGVYKRKVKLNRPTKEAVTEAKRLAGNLADELLDEAVNSGEAAESLDNRPVQVADVLEAKIAILEEYIRHKIREFEMDTGFQVGEILNRGVGEDRVIRVTVTFPRR